MNIKAIKAGGRVAALALFLSFLAESHLDNTFVQYPRQPEPETGRTTAYQVKGITVFISDEQRKTLSLIHWTQIVSGVVVGLTLLVLRGEAFKK